jgi:hypothetical protein
MCIYIYIYKQIFIHKKGKNIKVVAVGKATKQPKSLSSMLGGDSTEFDAEVVLQCKKRGLGYGIIL